MTLPVVIGKGPILEGLSAELDELRLLLSDAKAYLMDLQNREIKNNRNNKLKSSF